MSVHRPVFLNEVVRYLNGKPGDVIVDGTVGAGGHAERILKSIMPGGFLVGIDRDKEILEMAKARLSRFENHFRLVQGNFATLEEIVDSVNVKRVNGVLFDLGVSSYQLENASRGFSFRREGPLDMRMDSAARQRTAYHIVNECSREELLDIIRRYGEERYASRVVKAIVSERAKAPITTTSHLAELIRKSIPCRKPPKIHPATRTFQALRVAVNSELDNIRAAMPQAINVLVPSGRICVISFHSLEDRIVKEFFRNAARGCDCPPRAPVCCCGKKPQVKVITKRAQVPSPAERLENPRGRSAKLRVAEKISADANDMPDARCPDDRGK